MEGTLDILGTVYAVLTSVGNFGTFLGQMLGVLLTKYLYITG